MDPSSIHTAPQKPDPTSDPGTASSLDSLAHDLEELAATLSRCLSRMSRLAKSPAHPMRKERVLVNDLMVDVPAVVAVLRSLATRMESANGQCAEFHNKLAGLSSMVTPSTEGYVVCLRDMDSGRMLPAVHRFVTREDAVFQAKRLVGIQLRPDDSITLGTAALS